MLSDNTYVTLWFNGVTYKTLLQIYFESMHGGRYFKYSLHRLGA